ncbi:MAG: Kazal-type serine protease inhibitor domain-containing protein [Candidatus Pacearchaeota archaeon]
MKEKSLINPVLVIFLLIFLYLFFFFLFYPFYNKGITANIVFQPSLQQQYYPGEKLKGNLIISLNKNNTHKDLIPVNATFEIYVEGINVKNLTFAEIINLSDQAGKGNLSFGVFRNVNGKAPAQKGWGFTLCEFLPPPQTNITAKSEKPAKLTATSCFPGQTKEFLCPDGINKITQTCKCEVINITPLTQRCYWSPSDEEALQQCIDKYSCPNLGFSNIYYINLEKLNISLIDKDENGEANIKFRLIYRWVTPWNFSNPICRMRQQIPPEDQPYLPYITICDNYAINWSPVCGIDNITYPNACFAICQGNTQVRCYKECSLCPSIAPSIPSANLSGVSLLASSPSYKVHEVEINSIETNVSIKSIECSWEYACINNTEYNKTKKVWLIYKGENSYGKCIKASEIASKISPIIDICEIGVGYPFKFSISCYSYNQVIEKLVENNLAPDEIELDDHYIFLQNCRYGCRGDRCATGGGGGGGGGGAPPYCFPYWVCSNWGDCQPDNYQYRICIDINNCSQSDIEWWNTTGCGGNYNCLQSLIKPTESKPCQYQCIENWQCSEWSSCDPDTGIQTRECIDLNNCGTTYNKPQTVQACEVQQKPPTAPKKKEKNLQQYLPFLGLILLLIIIIVVILILLLSRRKGIEIKVEEELPSELIDYVKKARNIGMSDEEIRNKLKNAGWPDNLINAALSQ